MFPLPNILQDHVDRVDVLGVAEQSRGRQTVFRKPLGHVAPLPERLIKSPNLPGRRKSTGSANAPHVLVNHLPAPANAPRNIGLAHQGRRLHGHDIDAAANLADVGDRGEDGLLHRGGLSCKTGVRNPAAHAGRAIAARGLEKGLDERIGEIVQFPRPAEKQVEFVGSIRPSQRHLGFHVALPGEGIVPRRGDSRVGLGIGGSTQTDFLQPSRPGCGQNSRPHGWPAECTYRHPCFSA